MAASTSVVLLAVNNSPAVSRGYCEPNFTMRVKGLNTAGTAGRAITLESAQFELRLQNITSETNKLYVVSSMEPLNMQAVEIEVGSYTDVANLLRAINQALTKAGHSDVKVNYLRVRARVEFIVPATKILRMTKHSPAFILGLGEISGEAVFDVGDGKRSVTKVLPFAVDLSAGRRAVILYTNLIHPAVEYEDNSDSRVLKSFIIQTFNGINNYVFAKDDFRELIPTQEVYEISFWLRYNTGELIESGSPIFLDLRIVDLEKNMR